MTWLTFISNLLSFFNGDQYISTSLTIIPRYRKADSFRNKGEVGKARGKSQSVMAERRHHSQSQRNCSETQRRFLLRQNILDHMIDPFERNKRGNISARLAHCRLRSQISKGELSLQSRCPEFGKMVSKFSIWNGFSNQFRIIPQGHCTATIHPLNGKPPFPTGNSPIQRETSLSNGKLPFPTGVA